VTQIIWRPLKAEESQLLDKLLKLLKIQRVEISWWHISALVGLFDVNLSNEGSYLFLIEQLFAYIVIFKHHYYLWQENPSVIVLYLIELIFRL